MIEVRDTGCGIAAENLARIFTYGFTTKRDGHGFGLHSAACACAELGGSLTATSDGPGQGARFCIELPFEAPSPSDSQVNMPAAVGTPAQGVPLLSAAISAAIEPLPKAG